MNGYAHWNWCNRCLDVRDVRIEFVARWGDPEQGATLAGAGRPQKVIDWAEAVMEKSGGDAIFSFGSRDFVLVPVTTWHGDPVCPGHLMELHDRELRGGR